MYVEYLKSFFFSTTKKIMAARTVHKKSLLELEKFLTIPFTTKSHYIKEEG